MTKKPKVWKLLGYVLASSCLDFQVASLKLLRAAFKLETWEGFDTCNSSDVGVFVFLTLICLRDEGCDVVVGWEKLGDLRSDIVWDQLK